MMRLAFATASEGRIGGLETYLEAVVPEVVALGHQAALWCESPPPAGRPAMSMPRGVATERLVGAAGACALAAAWRPDAIFVQGLESLDPETALLSLPQSVFVAHNYTGVCISGTRAWTAPVARPCGRRFGPACLAHYFPKGCGGRSPLTMMRLYRRESRRQWALLKAAAVVTLSSHMRSVLLDHGLDAARVIHLPFWPRVSAISPGAHRSGATVSLAVSARLEPLKGVHLLLEALPLVRAAVRAPLQLVVIGDGSARAALESQASRVRAADPAIQVTFAGWAAPADRDRMLAAADLVVMPSVWPEPLGLSGMEAIGLGVPVAAFDVGGIRDWLREGVNGCLAPGDPPTAAGLSAAVIDALGQRDRLRLSPPAPGTAARTPQAHALGLIDLATRLASTAAAS